MGMGTSEQEWQRAMWALRTLGFEPSDAGFVDLLGLKVDVAAVVFHGLAAALESAIDEGVGIRWERAGPGRPRRSAIRAE